MIRFGMALVELIEQLTKGFVKATGRQPDNLEKIKIQQEAVQRFKDMNKVVDMEGSPIDTSKGIMGGRQADKFISQNKTMIDEAIDNASPGFSGDTKIDAELVAEDLAERMGLVYDDLPTKQRLDLYDQAYTGLSKQRFKGMKKPKDDSEEGFINFVRKTDPEGAAKLQKEEDRIKAAIEAANKKAAKKLKDKKIKRESLEDFVDDAGGVDPNDPRGLDDFIPDPEDMAQGGRIGYKDGPEKPGRRTFMKAAAGLASLLPFGIGKVGKVAAPVVAKAAEITGPALAKLVDTVMSAGKLLSVTGTRVKNMVTKKKLGKVEVEEDIADGSYIIKKDGKEIYYKPGRQDEMGGFDEDIIEVIEDRVKKAGGGIGYMLGE